jgi:hypothetical protein
MSLSNSNHSGATFTFSTFFIYENYKFFGNATYHRSKKCQVNQQKWLNWKAFSRKAG